MKKVAVFIVFLFAISFVVAEISIDIKLDKQEYNSGEEIIYEVLLPEDRAPISQQVTVTFSDSLDKKEITETVTSNQENKLLIDDSFVSGGWKVKATYLENSVEGRPFIIKASTNIEMKIEGNKLIITNNGNSVYREQIQIIIGNKVTPQTVTIGIGKTKELTLIAPEGTYDIRVTDGENSVSKTSVHLTGTGNVIGAYDETLVSGGIIGGTEDPNNESNFTSSSKIPFALIFVGAVFGLGILFFIERRLTRTVKS